MMLVTMLAVVLQSSPAPKTIVTVRSTPFCTALREEVAPVLRGLMRNDALIALGRSADLKMNQETTYGGYLESSYNQQGAAHVVLSPGLSGLFVERQRNLATALERNVETLEAILADKRRFPENLAVEEQMTLASITSQLRVVVGDQRVAINIISGEAETEALDQLFSAGPSTGSASLGDQSPLEAQEAAHDPSIRVQALSYPGYQSFGDSVYAKLAHAIGLDEKAIADSEIVVAETVLANAPACEPKP